MVFSWAKRVASGLLFCTTERPELKTSTGHHISMQRSALHRRQQTRYSVGRIHNSFQNTKQYMVAKWQVTTIKSENRLHDHYSDSLSFNWYSKKQANLLYIEIFLNMGTLSHRNQIKCVFSTSDFINYQQSYLIINCNVV